MNFLSKRPGSILLLFISFSLMIISCREDDDQPITDQTPTQQDPDTNFFVDSRDSNRYKYVEIGTQTWMAEDLKYLPQVFVPDSGSLAEARYYVYGYTGTSVSEAKATENYQTYGVLYNWPAAMNGDSVAQIGDVKGICPDGWHLPSDAEWTILTDFLGGRPVAGGKLKEAGTTRWRSPNVSATNESGFNALPAGNRTNQGQFEFIEENAVWWSATPEDPFNIYIRNVSFRYGDIYRIGFNKEYGFCVRCLQDGVGREGG